MMELPELIVLKSQISKALVGKEIHCGYLGNSPHKFVWYNQTHEEFSRNVAGKVLGEPSVKGRWLFLPLVPGYKQIFGEWGGKLIYHKKGDKIPAKYHLLFQFTDGTALSLVIQMWGAVELYKEGMELERKYIKNMAIDPLEEGFTYTYFHSILKKLIPQGKRSVKALLTQDQTIPGIGNSILQDILFRAKLHPKHLIQELSEKQIHLLFDSIQDTVHKAIEQGGRNDETDLFGEKGRYQRILDSSSVGKPCPICSAKIEKSNYLGGACYFCPACQV